LYSVVNCGTGAATLVSPQPWRCLHNATPRRLTRVPADPSPSKPPHPAINRACTCVRQRPVSPRRRLITPKIEGSSAVCLKPGRNPRGGQISTTFFMRPHGILQVV